MKCPHCGYKNGWDSETTNEIKGKEGSFYGLTNEIKMEREDEQERIFLVGCPNCSKVFMNAYL